MLSALSNLSIPYQLTTEAATVVVLILDAAAAVVGTCGAKK